MARFMVHSIPRYKELDCENNRTAMLYQVSFVAIGEGVMLFISRFMIANKDCLGAKEERYCLLTGVPFNKSE